MTKPILVVSIDTEEEGLWSGSYRPVANSCRNIERLPRAHELFRRLGVKPTYLVDHPVAADATARRILVDLAAGGAAEIGAHLHPWCTPPLEAHRAAAPVTYPHRLPAALQEAKLAGLCRTIRDAFGRWPTAYRAGRWGFDRSTVPVLERLGFAVDTSVYPLWWDGERGGPSFRRAPQAPYRLDAADITRPGSGAVVEIPASAGFIGRLARTFERATRLFPAAPGLRRVLVRLGLCALQPEAYPLDVMRALVDEHVARALPVLNVAFHSSALLPAATPFVRDGRELDAFMARLEGILEHALGRHRAIPLGLSEVPARLAL